MPIDFRHLIDPRHTVVLTQECQEGVVGANSLLPELAAACAEMVSPIRRLCSAARASGIRILHCVVIQRSDGYGRNRNARLFQATGKGGPRLLVDSPAAQLVAGIEPHPDDVLVPRVHGLSPFQGTELDSILRNEGVRTLVITGVSINVAITNLTFDAVNAGYQVVIPRDAVAGFPRDYVQAVFSHTLSAVATISNSDSIINEWVKSGPTP